jgi:cytochrome c553
MRAIIVLAFGLAACSQAPEQPAATDVLRLEQVSSDPVRHGERLSKVLGCTGCHDVDLNGRDWGEPGYGTLWTANLNRSAHRWSEAELTQMIVAGARPDRPLMEMPSEVFARLHPDDVSALVAYLKTLSPTGPVHPEATIGPLLAREIAAGEYRNSAQRVAEDKGKLPPDLGPEYAYGRHLASVTCAECHGSDLRGKPAPEPDATARPDLRMVAAYSRDEFRTLMQTGKAAGNREVGLMTRIAQRRYPNFTPGEEQAVYAYLVELARRDPIQ